MDFTPSPKVQELKARIVEFMGRDDVPVLAQAALTHAQFESIHPFPDGNGRAGRALLHAQLRHGGLTQEWARNDPDLDPLRADPRFTRLVPAAPG